MATNGKHSFFRQPEMIVAVSAIVLSLCGLFIALYEASIARRAERASVWPHVEVAASVQGTQVQIWVRNTGVGPARVRAANLSLDGAVLDNWSELLDSLQIDFRNITREYSLIGGRVLGVSTDIETIFAVDLRADANDPDATLRVAEAFFSEAADVELCYCSVYDECWTARLQDIMNRKRDAREHAGDAEGVDCTSVPRSSI